MSVPTHRPEVPDEPAAGLTHFVGTDGAPLDFSAAVDHLINRELTAAPASAALADELADVATALYEVGSDLDSMAAALSETASATVPPECYPALAALIAQVSKVGLRLSNYASAIQPPDPSSD